jgi:hypothetical protein
MAHGFPINNFTNPRFEKSLDKIEDDNIKECLRAIRDEFCLEFSKRLLFVKEEHDSHRILLNKTEE